MGLSTTTQIFILACVLAVVVKVLENYFDNTYVDEEVERYTKFTGCNDDVELYTVIRYKRTYKNGTITYISKRD